MSKRCWRKGVVSGVAIAAAAAVALTPSVKPPVPELMSFDRMALTAQVSVLAPPQWSLGVRAVQASVATAPIAAALQLNASAVLPNLADQIRAGAIPSLHAPLPTPPNPGPIPAPTTINSAIKGIYNAVEPWVRYGFELATYAVGWVPWVGWLAPQIMIFYNFGERIVRSITFNLDDWIFGPLPFFQGLSNVIRDSWDATVQLGIDQWNFWLPPLPPLPLAAREATVGPPEATVAPPEALDVASADAPPATEELASDYAERRATSVEPDGLADPAVTPVEPGPDLFAPAPPALAADPVGDVAPEDPASTAPVDAGSEAREEAPSESAETVAGTTKPKHEARQPRHPGSGLEHVGSLVRKLHERRTGADVTRHTTTPQGQAASPGVDDDAKRHEGGGADGVGAAKDDAK